ncbi:hypothetical protein LOK49_Contig85G00005 [Camellia lanceoleosa]|nr:hypothetical protein LOK49_Contig85G00005 [Camellia lanceoleosa]
MQQTRHKLLLMYPNQHRVPMKKKRRRMTTTKKVLMKQNNSTKKRCKSILAKRKQLLLKQTQKSMPIKKRQNFKYWKVMMISRKNQSQTSHSQFHAAKQTRFGIAYPKKTKTKFNSSTTHNQVLVSGLAAKMKTAYTFQIYAD